MPWDTKVLNQNLNLFPETFPEVHDSARGKVERFCIQPFFIGPNVPSTNDAFRIICQVINILLPPIFFQIQKKTCCNHHLQPPTLYTWNFLFYYAPGFTCDMWSASVIGKTYLCGTKSSWLLDNTRCLKGALGWKFGGFENSALLAEKLGGVFPNPSFLRSPKGMNTKPRIQVTFPRVEGGPWKSLQLGGEDLGNLETGNQHLQGPCWFPFSGGMKFKRSSEFSSTQASGSRKPLIQAPWSVFLGSRGHQGHSTCSSGHPLYQKTKEKKSTPIEQSVHRYPKQALQNPVVLGWSA